MKELHYNVTGQDRKELVGIISKVVGMKAVYKFMPTCAYVIAGITVEKDGTMVWDERTDQDTIEAVIIALAAAGFNPVKDEDEEETGLTIEIAEDRNTLVFRFKDSRKAVKRWQDRSRAESWTPEMKEAASQKAIERNRHNG